MSLTISRKYGTATIRTALSPAWPIGLLVLALPAAWVFSGGFTVDCQRQASGRVDATIRADRPGCAPQNQLVSDLRAVRIETQASVPHPSRPHRDHPGGTHVEFSVRSRTVDVHRVLLIDATGAEHPVSRSLSSGLGKYLTLSNAIQAFLDDPQARRRSARQPADGAAWYFLAVPLLALAAYLFGQAECTVDPEAREVRLRRTRWFGSTLRFPLSEVREFYVHQRPETLLTRQSPPEPRLRLADGKHHRLAWLWSAGTDDAFTATQALDRALHEALTRQPSPAQLPTQPGGAPSSDKHCVLCGQPCGDAPRLRDDAGRYYHEACYQRRFGAAQ